MLNGFVVNLSIVHLWRCVSGKGQRTPRKLDRKTSRVNFRLNIEKDGPQEMCIFILRHTILKTMFLIVFYFQFLSSSTNVVYSWFITLLFTMRSYVPSDYIGTFHWKTSNNNRNSATIHTIHNSRVGHQGKLTNMVRWYSIWSAFLHYI